MYYILFYTFNETNEVLLIHFKQKLDNFKKKGGQYHKHGFPHLEVQNDFSIHKVLFFLMTIPIKVHHRICLSCIIKLDTLSNTK